MMFVSKMQGMEIERGTLDISPFKREKVYVNHGVDDITVAYL